MDSLEEYNKKRDFRKTKEPKGSSKKSSSKGDLSFVVQKHDASRLHYDFRLEHDGVLLSWAVPKEPSTDKSDKRLAVRTEDHPLDYIDFEGIIPEDAYGGGTVMVWDKGTYRAEGTDSRKDSEKEVEEGLKDGSLKVVLKGKKLKGEWNLVKMKGKEKEQWLLIKGGDEFEGKNSFDQKSVKTGRSLEEIAKNGQEKTNGKGKSVNSKSGKKSGNSKNQKSSSNKSSNSKSKNSKDEITKEDLRGAKKMKSFPGSWSPQLATLTDEPFDSSDWIFEPKIDGYRALGFVKKSSVKLISRNGKSFNDKYTSLVEALEDINDEVVIDGEIAIEDKKGKTRFQWLQNYKENPDQGKLKYFVFDLLYFNGYDLREVPLIKRKKLLKAVVPTSDLIVIGDFEKDDGKEYYKKAEDKEWEGLIAKKKEAKYHTGKRTKDWLKVKIENEQEMVIGGFTEPGGSRKGLGALLCGYYRGEKFIYAGKVGTGFSDEVLEKLRSKLDRLERKTSPFKNPPDEKEVHWVTPKLVAQLRFTEWTKSGTMRHPVYHGLRKDKKAKNVVREKPTENFEALENDKLSFSNLDKVFWPEEGWTKGDVISYYNKVSDYILPFLKDRPQSLLRTPDGIKSDGFFQKDVGGQVPKWIKTKKIKSESKGESSEYLLCQDKDTLLFMANWGCVEINPWSSRVGHLDKPDYIIFDLDPNDVDFEDVVKTAQKLKDILDHLDVPSFIKTSGGRGLHIFIPVEARYSYDHTKTFSHLVGKMVHRELPDLTSLERSPSKRKGKVYLDYLQNGKGKTMACAYSLRPRPGANVSTPLEWKEVKKGLDPSDFNIETMPERLNEKGDLWKNFFDSKINLKDLLNHLKESVGDEKEE